MDLRDKHPAIFLDRDGVVIENQPNYVRRWEDVIFFPTALQALAELRSSAYKIVLVTNQSAVGRGLISQAKAEEINRRVVTEIERSGGRVDGTFMCVHAPEEGCTCRKPQPGLLIQAAEALSIDLGRSYMIGDAVSDLQAGQSAGVKQAILLLTGRGADQAEKARHTPNLLPYSVYKDLREACADIRMSAAPI